MPVYRLFVLEFERLIGRKKSFWWQFLVVALANASFILLYQFPLHLGGTSYSFSKLASLLNMLLLPLFVVADLHIDQRSGRDLVWLWLPLDVRVWLAARILAWLSLQGLVIVAFFVWLGVGSYWFFNDFGLVFGAICQILVSSLWTILLGFAARSSFKQGWLALIIVYVCQVGFLALQALSLLLLERAPWLAALLESFSYEYRMTNWQRGIFSVADALFWLIGLYVLWRITVKSLQKVAAIQPPSAGLQKTGQTVVLACSAVLFLCWPLEFDLTNEQIYRPSLAARSVLGEVEQPFEIERWISTPLRWLGYERWFMRRILQYQQLNEAVIARLVIARQQQAQSLGLQLVRELQAQGQFAGLFFRYRELGTQEAVAQSIESLDEATVLAARRLQRQRMPRILFIIDEAQLQSDFSLLSATLAKEFLIDWLPASMLEFLPFVEADAYVIIGGSDLDASHWRHLEQERLQGRGLWINAMGVRISSRPEFPPKRFDALAVDEYLSEKGLALGRNLLLDPDGYFMASGAGFSNYPLWLSGRVAADGLLAKALVGLAPLMSVELTAQAGWQPLVMSSSLAREQSGLLEFSFFELWNREWQDGASRMIAGQYVGDDGGALVVFGSTTWLSDMIKDAQTFTNISKMKGLARYITGDKSLMEAQSRFNIITQMRRPFAAHEMLGQYIRALLWVFISWLSLSVLLFILAYYIERRGVR